MKIGLIFFKSRAQELASKILDNITHETIIGDDYIIVKIFLKKTPSSISNLLFNLIASKFNKRVLEVNLNIELKNNFEDLITNEGDCLKNIFSGSKISLSIRTDILNLI